MYLNYEQFLEQYPDTEIKVENFEIIEKRAEIDIDGLTFNRITAKGFDSLTGFQKSLVRHAIAKHIMFVQDNSELLDSYLSSYSISGVSMSFDKSKVVEIGNVITSKAVYGILMQTGLCYRGLI